MLGGSWVVANGVISPLMGYISIVTLLITPLILPVNLQVVVIVMSSVLVMMEGEKQDYTASA